MPEAHYLEVSGLSKRFGSGEHTVTAIEDVSFALEKGRFLSILGTQVLGAMNGNCSIMDALHNAENHYYKSMT